MDEAAIIGAGALGVAGASISGYRMGRMCRAHFEPITDGEDEGTEPEATGRSEGCGETPEDDGAPL